jgi:hypothetical protein
MLLRSPENVDVMADGSGDQRQGSSGGLRADEVHDDIQLEEMKSMP